MKNKVITTTYFENKLKRLHKKFPSLEEELLFLEDELLLNPKTGIPLGDNLYKIRVASKSKGRGKSGGFRVITSLIVRTKEETIIYLITIYDKSEEESIRKETLLKLVKQIIG